ncbi:hypothetical protein GIB67_003130 [Kingdonia uniflora]|uniref:Uncharacterized protein n=1 Tax=Kingdonia uniflora TaxID=39325 RepID=A0A7J7N6D1_9MAGN|nr:hypothetical protein GIB67_003130 [Kingdonia uniflora]
MRTYKDYVKNPKRVKGYITNRYVLDEAILYCMEYIPNGRKGAHKHGQPTFMDDNAKKEQSLEILKYEQVHHWVLSSYDGIEEGEKKYDIYLKDYLRVSRRRGSTNDEYVLPEAVKRKLMRSANNLWRNGKKTIRKRYDEWDTDEARKKNCPKINRPKNWVQFVNLTSTKEVKASRERNKINRSKMVTPHTIGRKEMEVDPTTTRSDSFLVSHTHSDVTLPTALLAEKVIAVKDIIMKNRQSKYLDFDHDPLAQVFDKNRFSQYKAENDVKFDSLKDMVTSLRSFERTVIPTINVDRSRMSTPLLREEADAHFLNLHEDRSRPLGALVIPGYQESEESE